MVKFSKPAWTTNMFKEKCLYQDLYPSCISLFLGSKVWNGCGSASESQKDGRLPSRERQMFKAGIVDPSVDTCQDYQRRRKLGLTKYTTINTSAATDDRTASSMPAWEDPGVSGCRRSSGWQLDPVGVLHIGNAHQKHEPSMSMHMPNQADCKQSRWKKLLVHDVDTESSKKLSFAKGIKMGRVEAFGSIMQKMGRNQRPGQHGSSPLDVGLASVWYM